MKKAIGKTNEWYTPGVYIDAVRDVLGQIDIDPASCEYANKLVQASRYYTQEENGLMRDWPGKAFLNPPFGRTESGESLLKCFTAKLLQQYEAKVTTEAILLIPVNTATRWFVPLWQYPICFPKKRIRFYSEAGLSDGAAFPTCFVYFGDNQERFIEVFKKFGPIATGIGPAPARYDQLELFSSEVA